MVVMRGETRDWIFDEDDRRRMGTALDEARKALAAGDVPVGAVVVDVAGSVLAAAHNRREAEHDPTAHAELLALRDAAHARGSWRLEECTLYVTLEPCAMCAAACVQARLAAVVWGASDPKAGFCGSVGNLLEDPRLNHRVGSRGGLEAGAAGALLDEFFAKRRGRR